MAIFMPNIIVDKCGAGNFFQKRLNGSIAEQADAGVVMNGTFTPATMILGFTGQAFAYRYDSLDTLLVGSTYEISGHATPVGAEVFISFADGNRQEDLLSAMSENPPAASTISDSEDGSFSFTEVLHKGGLCIVWIKCPPDFANLSTMSLSVQVTKLSSSEGIPLTTLVDIASQQPCPTCAGTGTEKYECTTHGVDYIKQCESCGGTGNISGETCTNCGGMGHVCTACVEEGTTATISRYSCSTCNGTGQVKYKNWSGIIDGNCPADAAGVYLSSGYSDNRTLAELESTIITSAVPVANDDGSFSYLISAGTVATTHTIWCLSETGGILTARVSGSYSDEEPVCLSGDTIITMADGSGKRLDELEVGDALMAGDGYPTTVVRTGRDIWRPFHTLYHFEDGTVIDEISVHRFYNVEQGFWQKLHLWNIGEHAKRLDGTQVALVRVERVDEEAECFGLWTESDDYFANGLLSGNAGANRDLLENASFEQAMDMAISLDEQEIEKMFFGGVL
mgnify:CR=1 FL=1